MTFIRTSPLLEFTNFMYANDADMNGSGSLVTVAAYNLNQWALVDFDCPLRDGVIRKQKFEIVRREKGIQEILPHSLRRLYSLPVHGTLTRATMHTAHAHLTPPLPLSL